MSVDRYFLAGLPNSGKSSYLAAFWVYANNKTVNPALAITSYPEDADYLNTLQANWFGFTKVPRTSAGAERTVKLEVKRASDQRAFTLALPDLSGESFAHTWSERHWTNDFHAVVSDASGALWFIRPGEIEDGATLGQVRELMAALPADTPFVGNPAAPAPAEYDLRKAPTQIKLIENLQLLVEHANIRKPFRLGLVVSAWDAVISQDSDSTPKEWLRARMPCLLQYLAANRDLFEVAIFGVSAQGGDYDKPVDGFFDTQPHRRCVVAGDSVTNSSDITAPVHWLLKS